MNEPNLDEAHPHGEVHESVLADHILHVQVDRTKKRNAITPRIINALAEALTRLDEDPDLWVGVLSFAGDHTTAGLDMALFFEAGADGLTIDTTKVDPFGLGRRLSKPLITAVQGVTYTAGIELALAGEIIVAASNTRLCQIEPKRGLAAMGGATIRYIQRAGWGNGMYHLIRADEFDADEAYRIGLVQEVVDPGTQVERALEIATELLHCAPLVLQQMLANARLAITDGEQAAIAAIPEMRDTLFTTEDFSEGFSSFLERRDARFVGR